RVRRTPGQIQAASRGRTVPQVEVDQALVREAGLLGKLPEVRDGRCVESNRDGPFQTLRVGILLGFGKVIVLSHGDLRAAYVPRSSRSAFRAEMRRITPPPSRSQCTTTSTRRVELKPRSANLCSPVE